MQRLNRILWQQSCLGKAAAGGRPSAPVAVPAQSQPAYAHDTCRSAHGSPKHTSRQASVETWRLRWGQKPGITPKLESKTEVLVEPRLRTEACMEARSANRTLSKPYARVEAGSARRSRISTLLSIVNLKTIVKFDEPPYSQIEYCCRIFCPNFVLSWLQLKGYLEDSVDSCRQDQNSTKRKLRNCTRNFVRFAKLNIHDSH